VLLVAVRVGVMPDALAPSMKIRTLRDLVAAVPLFVGYQPRESLVVVSLRGPGRRLGATMCVPLPDEQTRCDSPRRWRAGAQCRRDRVPAPRLHRAAR
jgi:hypothetical protein